MGKNNQTQTKGVLALQLRIKRKYSKPLRIPIYVIGTEISVNRATDLVAMIEHYRMLAERC